MAKKSKIEEFIEQLEVDDVAKAIREEWASYAVETLGDKAPAGFTKPWEETGEWGREGNRRVARRVVRDLALKLEEFEERNACKES